MGFKNGHSVPTYVARNLDGSWDAFVEGKGFSANTSLAEATRFIRDKTGKQYGAVPCYDRTAHDWDSEIEIKRPGNAWLNSRSLSALQARPGATPMTTDLRQMSDGELVQKIEDAAHEGHFADDYCQELLRRLEERAELHEALAQCVSLCHRHAVSVGEAIDTLVKTRAGAQQARAGDVSARLVGPE